MDSSFTAFLWLNWVLVGFFFCLGWILMQAIYQAILWVLAKGRKTAGSWQLLSGQIVRPSRPWRLRMVKHARKPRLRLPSESEPFIAGYLTPSSAPKLTA